MKKEIKMKKKKMPWNRFECIFYYYFVAMEFSLGLWANRDIWINIQPKITPIFSRNFCIESKSQGCYVMANK